MLLLSLLSPDLYVVYVVVSVVIPPVAAIWLIFELLPFFTTFLTFLTFVVVSPPAPMDVVDEVVLTVFMIISNILFTFYADNEIVCFCGTGCYYISLKQVSIKRDDVCISSIHRLYCICTYISKILQYLANYITIFLCKMFDEFLCKFSYYLKVNLSLQNLKYNKFIGWMIYRYINSYFLFLWYVHPWWF